MNDDIPVQNVSNDTLGTINLLGWMKLGKFDLSDPGRFSKIQEIANFMKNYDEDSQRYMIRKVTLTKNVDPLNQVWEYIQLLTQKKSAESRHEASKKAHKEEPTPLRAIAVKSAKGALDLIKKEILLYER